MDGEIAGGLGAWLPEQRWYAGKGRQAASVRVARQAELAAGPPSLLDLLVEVRFADGGMEHYQVPVGLGDGRVMTDATASAGLRGVLLELLASGGEAGGVRFVTAAGAPPPPRAATSRLLGVEQSNTCMVFDEQLILKLFRRLEPGENPELELTRALAGLGFEAVAAPLAWVEGFGSTLGILQPYFGDSTTGWELALDSVRELFGMPELGVSSLGGDFGPESERLGELTARMHAALAEALPSVRATGQELRPNYQQMVAQLELAAREVPQLDVFRSAIEAVYDSAEASGSASGRHRQRIHGDFHLGQVLRTGQDAWVIFDFEGEPARSMEQRRRLASPLRDVAGMLRSFDYAASAPAEPRDGEPMPGPALSWVERNRSAYLSGYLSSSASAGWLPPDTDLLLRAFELDKAVYEVRYELRHRPEWLGVPLAGIARILEA